jgi:hypothetical protein
MGWTTEVQFPAGAGKGLFYLHCRVQTGSGAHQASYPMDTGIFCWDYSGRIVELTTHVRLVPKLRMCGGISVLSA